MVGRTKSLIGCTDSPAALLLITALLIPLFGKASEDRRGTPASTSVKGAASGLPATPSEAAHPCVYVISSWLHLPDKTDEHAAGLLMEAINHLLPDPDRTRATTQKLREAERALFGKLGKQVHQDHYDIIQVTETFDANTGRMTVEISVHSVPYIPGHDFRLGPDTLVRIDGCTLPVPGDKGERSCQREEIDDIAEKIAAHDKDKHQTH